jgi:hypothetical protein
MDETPIAYEALPGSHEHGSGVARVAFERQLECGVTPLRAFDYAMHAYAHAYEYNERVRASLRPPEGKPET